MYRKSLLFLNPRGSGIMDAFEELPALLVVLIAVSLFSVSVAHATMSWDNHEEYEALNDNCQTFAVMVRASNLLASA